MDVSAALVAYPQPAELVQPTQGPLDHPAVHSQPAAVFRALPSQGRHDVARQQFLAMPPRVILSVDWGLDRSRFAQRRHFRAAVSQQPGQDGFGVLAQGWRRREVIGAAGLDGVAGSAVGAGDRMVDFHHHVA